MVAFTPKSFPDFNSSIKSSHLNQLATASTRANRKQKTRLFIGEQLRSQFYRGWKSWMVFLEVPPTPDPGSVPGPDGRLRPSGAFVSELPWRKREDACRSWLSEGDAGPP